MIKKMLLPAILLAFVTISIAANPPHYLVRIDRDALLENSKTPDQFQLLQELSVRMNILYASKSYILADAGDNALAELPSSVWKKLDTFPLEENWYLLTMQKGKENRITAQMGIEITRMDQTILVKSTLSDISLGQVTDMPYVRLKQTPLRLNNQRVVNTNRDSRVNFGNLLNQINADSIAWFMQQLQNFSTRFAAADNRLEVAIWIANQFQRFGIVNSNIEMFWYYNTIDQYNVVATIPGTLAPNKYIIVGGHHDSILYDENDPMLIAPGADDNASGTAAALEMARVMKANNYQPECTIKFITFACEELGLFGSQYNALSALNLELDIKVMINHDMISHCTLAPGDWYLCMNPYEGFEGYTDYAMNIAGAQTTLTPYAWFLNSSGSDSYSYWQLGYPAIYFDEDQFCPFYHTADDLMINTNPLYVKEIIKASTATAVSFDQSPSPVLNVQITDTGTGNSLQVNWSNSGLEPDVVSYKVYVAPDSLTAPLQYPTANTTFILPNLVSGNTFYIGVAAIDDDGNEGLARFVTGTPYIVPQIPTGFTDLPILHAVSFNWSANAELDIAGYRIYRSTALDGTYNLLNSNLITATFFTDSNLQDVTYYYYKLVAVDADNHESLPADIIKSRALTFNQGILIMDETRNNAGNTVFAPNDEVSDQFFDTVLHNFQRTQFDTETDGTLRLADIGIYSSILWHGNDFASMSYPYLVREEISKYVQAGGKILISSYKPSLAFAINNNYPFTFVAGDFMYDNFGVEYVAYENSARFKYAGPGNSGFPALTVDTLKTLVPLLGHIYNIESIGASANAQNIYFYGSDYSDSTSQGIMNGMPVGVYYQPNPGKTILLSFPLYNMYEADVTTLMHYAFNQLFGEIVSAEDATETPFTALSISRIYPNPFRASVKLEINLAKTNHPLEVSVYNIKGQKVKTLFSGIAKDRKPSWNWDGKDEQGRQVSSSIYFVKAVQDGKAVSRKLIRLN